MKSHFYHIQFNINYENISFYKEFMHFLGWNTLYESPEATGFSSEEKMSVWFLPSKNSQQQDYDTIGMNHISFRVESQEEVDETVEYLKSKNVNALFETPRHRPEFSSSENETYYQVIFETPDKIQIEVVYTGPKT